MDEIGKDHSNGKSNPGGGLKLEKVELNEDIEVDDEDIEVDDESKALLAPPRGGISKKSGNKRRKVQWNDKNGNKLAEVLEFQPSDSSESEDEESDSCLCTIM